MISINVRAGMPLVKSGIGSIGNELLPALCVFGRCHYARTCCPGFCKLVVTGAGILQLSHFAPKNTAIFAPYGLFLCPVRAHYPRINAVGAVGACCQKTTKRKKNAKL